MGGEAIMYDAHACQWVCKDISGGSSNGGSGSHKSKGKRKLKSGKGGCTQQDMEPPSWTCPMGEAIMYDAHACQWVCKDISGGGGSSGSGSHKSKGKRKLKSSKGGCTQQDMEPPLWTCPTGEAIMYDAHACQWE